MSLVATTAPQRADRPPGGAAAIAARTLLAAELLCESVDLHAGERVLDVACGSGNATLAAARRFARVVGVDGDPCLLERARRRAGAEGLEATFLEGDPRDLAFPDGAFDVVLSAGAGMSTPDLERVAAELLRVCRPGGRIGLVLWTPGGYVGGRLAAAGGQPPPPAPGELFGPDVEVTAPRRSLLWRFPSAEHQVEFLAACHGPTLTERRAELLGLARRFDVSEDDTLVLGVDYLEVVARKPTGG